jgi:hypothetical protein
MRLSSVVQQVVKGQHQEYVASTQILAACDGAQLVTLSLGAAKMTVNWLRSNHETVDIEGFHR